MQPEPSFYCLDQVADWSGLKTIKRLELPDGIERSVHQVRLVKLAREGAQMTAQHLRDLEPTRRYAYLASRNQTRYKVAVGSIFVG